MANVPFPAGVYAASLTWFSEGDDQEIDYDLQEKHLTYLIEAGLTGSEFRIKHGNSIFLYTHIAI